MYFIYKSVLFVLCGVHCLLNKFTISFPVFAVFSVEWDCVVVCVCVFFGWKNHVLSSIVCVCCVCDPNVNLGVPSIYLFVCVFICCR